MMTLTDKLNEIRQGAKEKIPQEMRDIMQRATRELRESGIMQKALNVGDALPSFELAAPAGQMISSEDLLKQGSLVLTFYRGVW
jgi:hypothetical protein